MSDDFPTVEKEDVEELLAMSADEDEDDGEDRECVPRTGRRHLTPIERLR